MSEDLKIYKVIGVAFGLQTYKRLYVAESFGQAYEIADSQDDYLEINEIVFLGCVENNVELV